MALRPQVDRQCGTEKQRLAAVLSVSERTVREWLSRIDKDRKEERNRRIFDLWMACHTQEEIAEAVSCSRETVRDMEKEFGEISHLRESAKAAANHATDFEPPIYNVWKQQTKSAGVEPPGNTDPR